MAGVLRFHAPTFIFSLRPKVCLEGTAASLELLLSRGAKPDAIAFSDYGERPVHCAAINAKPRALLEALERYGANLAAVDQAENSALDILVGGETCFGLGTACIDREELLQAIEFLMEHGVVPKETLEVDRDEKMDRDTREKIKELIARRQARQWMMRIDKDLKEIRDTRSAIQTKVIMIEAAMEENNMSVSPTGSSSSRIDPEVLRSQVRDEIRREAESLRFELNEKLDEINFMGVGGGDFVQKPQEPDQISQLSIPPGEKHRTLRNEYRLCRHT